MFAVASVDTAHEENANCTIQNMLYEGRQFLVSLHISLVVAANGVFSFYTYSPTNIPDSACVLDISYLHNM